MRQSTRRHLCATQRDKAQHTQRACTATQERHRLLNVLDGIATEQEHAEHAQTAELIAAQKAQLIVLQIEQLKRETQVVEGVRRHVTDAIRLQVEKAELRVTKKRA